MKKAKYAVFVKCIDNVFEATFNAYSYAELMLALADIRDNLDVVLVWVKKISSSGEYTPYRVPSKYL